ncbi:hypothetical protein KHA80_15495 [Anaerobacillus sp. HL2]|nr:hypothetical protein KHA80_15495 [Anaerobacillus sp. HL2]
MSNHTFTRKVYLQDKPKQIAKEELLQKIEVDSRNRNSFYKVALGRITALPIMANLSMPHYHASAMDGIAVRAEAYI